jgi:SAM-dependent methyltransferase
MSSKQRNHEPDALRSLVREGYTRVAEEARTDAAQKSRRVGYQDQQLAAVPEAAVDGLGCGNPTAIDSLRPGEVVVDLGSGAGMDAFLAARAVGPEGRVIGIDMTDAMLERARENARKSGLGNVEFRKGFIEQLPLEDESVDVILSNCVINLSPEKQRVYAEAYRVLRPGGRVMVSDIVLERPLPEKIVNSVEAYVGCVGGATLRSEYLETIEKAGFREVRVTKEACAGALFSLDDPEAQGVMERLELSRDEAKQHLEAITSLHIYAVK